MVQRKVPSKLGIQADDVKSEERLGNLRPSSYQHHDSKTRGPDMKKKMKRSRSIKLSGIESLRSSPLRKNVTSPVKSTPLRAPTTTTTPQKQPMIQTTGGSPNYMKATSSSEARKERRRNSSNSKLSSVSSDKPSRSLSRSSSLKLVRTLTKTPSFKPARSSRKKCSKVALCADTDVQKATCSSTLKDSKSPAYLMLNPGGTEAEGTSVLKVCPYTYCSLNGHHHTPSPPLKCFLKAKRRSMKAQKSAKLNVPSPCRVKPSVKKIEEISSELLILSGENHMPHEEYSISSTNSPIVKDMGMDFFIEIYANSMTDGTEVTGKHTADDDGTTEASAEHDRMKQGEMVADASPYMEINYTIMEEDDCISEASDIEWEEGQFSTAEIHMEAGPEKEDRISLEYPTDIKQFDLPDEPKVVISDDMISNCTEEILVDQVLKELFVEEATSFDAQSRDSDSEMEDLLLEFFEEEQFVEKTTQSNDGAACNGHFSEDTLFEVPTTVEGKSDEAGRDLTGDANSSTDESTAEAVAANANIQDNGVHETDHIFTINSSSGDAENDCNTGITFEDLNDQEDKSIQVDETIEFSDSGSKLEEDGGQKLKEAEAIENLAMIALSQQELSHTEAEDPILEPKQISNVESSVETQISDSSHRSSEPGRDDIKENGNQNHIIVEDCPFGSVSEDGSSCEEPAMHCHGLSTFMDPEEQNDLRIYNINSAVGDTGEVDKMALEVCTQPLTEETVLATNNGSSAQLGSRYHRKGSISSQEVPSICNRKWTINCRKPIMDLEEERDFNPREPNFLPLVPEPEAEKVDLKHQTLDDRKNSEEWMIDYALQQTVTKLAPARKRKVALLVEAFEAVLPIPNYEPHIRNRSSFPHTRPIQACS